MIIRKLHIKGFRNYRDTVIRFEDKNLIIGANDVGKTNMLYALRLLFDKSISEKDLELVESDYYAYEDTSSVEITAYIEEATEECLVSAFGGNLIDNKIVIRYVNDRDGNYRLFVGGTDELLEEQAGRYYIKYLNMQYVDTNRDLHAFLKRERNEILKISKAMMSEPELLHDEEKMIEIQEDLNSVNNKVNELHYIERALSSVNTELESMSAKNEGMQVRFVAGQSDAGKMMDNLCLAYADEENFLSVGGDGRNNQVFISTWVAKQNIQRAVDHVTFYAIEEPEAHLHPHQQRKLSEYILNQFEEQVFITSHSPQIATRFDPGKIIRLYQSEKNTKAAGGGINCKIREAFDSLGYRLNIISAETFFSDGVFLVEGTSETILYNSLAIQNGIDLDKYNMSVLSVEGVGFKPYVAVCEALGIPFVLRTDNDVFRKTKDGANIEYYAGVTRAVSIAELLDGTEDIVSFLNNNTDKNEWSLGNKSEENSNFNQTIRGKLETIGIFLSDVDLETDLAYSGIQEKLLNFYGENSTVSLIEKMQQRKAENMRAFVNDENTDLTVLGNDDLLKPIKVLKNKIVEMSDIHEAND